MFWFLVTMGIIALFCVSSLCWEVVNEWFQENKTLQKNEIGCLIKKRLENGNYKVIGGIFTKGILKTKKCVSSKAWEAEELDSDLEEKFNGKNKVVLEI